MFSLFLTTAAAAEKLIAITGKAIIGKDCLIQKQSIPNDIPANVKQITWTGACRDGKADGEGTAKWVYDFDAEEAAKHVPGLLEMLKDQTISYEYEGEVQAGRINGQGRLRIAATAKGWHAETQEGTFTNGKLNGQGKLYEEKFLRYEGGFKDGVYDGQGKLYEHAKRGIATAELATVTEGRVLYQGGLKDGSFHGEGTISWRNDNKLEGHFDLGKITEGRYTFANGNYYQAKWNGQSPIGEFPCFWDGKHTTCKGYYGEGKKRGQVRPVE